MLIVALALPFAVEGANAQAPVRNRPGILRPNRRLQQVPEEQAVAAPNARRQQLEQQIRRSMWRVAKQRIGFSDEQMTRLERTSQRFDQRRRQLLQQERVLRVSLRRELLADSAANQAAIATSLDQLHGLQQQRLDLQAEEQKEFGTFMTPQQRAKFFALQEQVRKRMQDLVRARPDSASAQLQTP